jgi:hypothetical protein
MSRREPLKLNKLEALRQPGETLSGTTIRLVALEAGVRGAAGLSYLRLRAVRRAAEAEPGERGCKREWAS